jgi:exonuclease III
MLEGIRKMNRLVEIGFMINSSKMNPDIICIQEIANQNRLNTFGPERYTILSIAYVLIIIAPAL